MLELTSANYRLEVHAAGRLMLVHFYGSDWGACQHMDKALIELEKDLGEILTIGRVDMNAPENEDLVRNNAVMRAPAILLYHGGTHKRRLYGFSGFHRLRMWLHKQLELGLEEEDLEL